MSVDGYAPMILLLAHFLLACNHHSSFMLTDELVDSVFANRSSTFFGQTLIVENFLLHRNQNTPFSTSVATF